jgi:RNA polymerase sigma-70 factor (ECF subfamily)
VAEDLAHEVFLSAFENISGYASRGFPFSSWLYQIARNKVIDYYRTRKNNLSFEMVSEEVFKINDLVEKDLNQTLALEKVWKAVETLSDVEQDVLIMRFVDDLSHKEIAGAIGKSEGAIRLIQHRAINNLKQVLEDERGTNN